MAEEYEMGLGASGARQPQQGQSDGGLIPAEQLQERPARLGDTRNQRTVQRRLNKYHIFFISISGVLGAGLYVRSGSMLQVGGPSAVLLPFAILMVLTSMVMQCIGEMLCIWPIPGALMEFVSAFVDDELGIAVGVAYWFAYSMGFAALITAVAGEANIWNPGKAWEGAGIFVGFPVILLAINWCGVYWYGLLEIIGGSLKLLFIFVVIVMMIVVNRLKVDRTCEGCVDGIIGNDFYSTQSFFGYDNTEVFDWGKAFFVALQIAAYAFVGIEIPAATALEAKMEEPGNDNIQNERSWWRRKTSAATVASPLASDALRHSATRLPWLVGVLYILAGLMVTLNVSRSDCALPTESWLARPNNSKCSTDLETSTTSKSNSAFVIAAQEANLPWMADVITSFLIFTALSSANTALYVASRTLFSLTGNYRPRGSKWNPVYWVKKILEACGEVNNHGVPGMALIVSVAAFIWVPFLYLSKHSGAGDSVGNLLEVLAEMASVCCIIVWACECFAFTRFYKYIKMHKDEIKRADDMPPLYRSWHEDASDETSDPSSPGKRSGNYYPYRSFLPSATPWIAFGGCLTIILVAGGAPLWNSKHYFSASAFVSAYLAPLMFLILWFGLKLDTYRHLRFSEWSTKDPGNWEQFRQTLQTLNDRRRRKYSNA